MSASTQNTVGGGIWKEIPLLDGESVIDQQYARYRKKRLHRAVGRLFVTNQRLLFSPAKWTIPWRDEPVVVHLKDISAIGRANRPWLSMLLWWNMSADSWFIDTGGNRHWFDVGWGWNKLWLKKFADRLGLPLTDESSP